MIDRHESQGRGPLPQLSTVTGASGGPGGGTRRPQGGRRPIGPATGRGPQGLLDLRQAPLLRPRQAAQAATTEGPGSTPNRRAARTSQTRTRRVPTRSPQRRVLRSSDRLLPRVRARPAAHADHRAADRPAGRDRRGTAVDPGAPQSSGMVPPLYQREFGVTLQFCLAHLIREVKFLTTLPDVRDRTYGERLREALRRLFGVIHRREELPASVLGSQLEAARAEVLRCGTQDVPETKPSRNLAKRLETHGESYFRFLTTPGMEPTNNLAEQAIRFVVLDRLVTQGTRSEVGNR